MRSLLPPTKKIQTELSFSTLTFEDNIDLVMNSNSWDRQRRKTLGSRVALLPGKFWRIWKVFARITEKTQMTANFPDDFKNCPDFPDDCQFYE